jgi:hypothetical protein
MRIPTSDQWRYEGLAESLARMLVREYDRRSEEVLKDFILHAFDRVYGMGRDCARPPAIPVTDLTSIPEILERVKERKGGEPWQ